MRILFCLFCVFLGHASFASNRVGNGGGAWVCRERNDMIRWIIPVDLYEADYVVKLDPAELKGSLAEIVQSLRPRILALTWDPAIMEAALDKLNLLSPNPPAVIYVDKRLPVINDSMYNAVPDKSLCDDGNVAYEQVVRYEDDGPIFVQRKLFSALTPVQQAAIVIHEAVYAGNRLLRNDTNSIYTRHMVGLIFSTLSESDMIQRLREANSWSGYLPPGTYEVTIKKLRPDGSFHPLQAKTFAISTPVNPSSDEARQGYDSTTVDANGKAVIKLRRYGERAGLQSMDLEIDDVPYWGFPADVGWSEDFYLASERLVRFPLACTEYTLALETILGPGQLLIVCTDKN